MILARLSYTNGETDMCSALVDVSLSGNGEVPAGSTRVSASGSGVIFDQHAGSGFTNPGLSLPGSVVYLLRLSLRIFLYDTREKRFWQYAYSSERKILWVDGAY